MKGLIILLFIILSCAACTGTKPCPAAKEQLILIVPDQLMQEPKQLQELKE